MASAIDYGLPGDLVQSMTMGQIIDYCIEQYNRRIRAEKAEKNGGKRIATQADIDAFLGG